MSELHGAGPMEEDAPEPTSGGDQFATATAARLAREASQRRMSPFIDQPINLESFILLHGGTADDPPQEWLDAPVHDPSAAGSAGNNLPPDTVRPADTVRSPDAQTFDQLLPSASGNNNPLPAGGNNQPAAAAGNNSPPAAANNPPPANVTNMQTAMECPITKQMFIDPVTTPGGITYERGALIEALRRNPTCPSSRTPLTIEECSPNLTVKSMCETLRRSAGTDLFEHMRTQLVAGFTEADLSRVHEEMLKKEKDKLKTLEQFEKAQAAAKKKKLSSAGNIAIQKNILKKEGHNKEGFKKLMVSMATTCGVNQEKFEWLVEAASKPAFDALLKAIKGNTGTDAKITQANVKITKYKLDYEAHSTMASATFEQRITAEDVVKDTKTLAAATTAEEDAKNANLSFDFMKAGGDPSVWEKLFFRKKDDEDDDDILIAFASCVICYVPDIMDYLPVPPVEEKAEPERDASAAPLAPVR